MTAAIVTTQCKWEGERKNKGRVEKRQDREKELEGGGKEDRELKALIWLS